MTFLQSILLGLIQGVAEFLPISSSGHLAIAQNLLNINAEVPAFYVVLLHLGTLVAVVLNAWFNGIRGSHEVMSGAAAAH